MYTFNLFGDPSLEIEGISLENNPPFKPTINGTNKGVPGTEYTFCIIAEDPENDSLFVKWDWGDGTSSELLGPIISGTEVCESHIWDEKDTYTISVTVEDEHGAEVRAYKEVIMPKTDIYTFNFEWFFQRFPNAFPILRYIIDFLN
jgi:hypothetical protein